MKHLLSHACIAAVAALALAGCSDTSTTTGPGTTTADTLKFSQGDKFTYNYYPRDMSNQNQTTSKQVKVWTVLSAGQTIGGRSGVSVIGEDTYQTDGTTPTGEHDTLYFQASADGKLYQYNLMRSVVKRIQGAGAFLDSVPAAWIEISETKTKTATTWSSTGGAPLRDTVTAPVVGQVRITLSMDATHAGTQSVTVPKATYTDAVHTDQKVVIDVKSSLLNATDSLMLHYDVAAKDGIIRQMFDSKSVNLTGSPIDVPGFDMQLVSVTRK
ncbi:MAG: hypothetical protein JWQ98_3523 [Chlorobi bacterium]|jgi:hypothetical protein|nr:hypothetical protein [Chlorobiota bacterium]